ncbi:MAG: DUF3791 domain-containing protein [Treponema sp.]|nr:DUF3791 domain-containing protein [Treponema sp.]
MKTDIVNDFLIYVIEEYKFLENKTAAEVMDLFSKHNVFEYITKHYDALHIMGGRAIADDINLIITGHNNKTKKIKTDGNYEKN